MQLKETPIKSSFLGFGKRGTCPVCDALVLKSLGTSAVLPVEDRDSRGGLRLR